MLHQGFSRISSRNYFIYPLAVIILSKFIKAGQPVELSEPVKLPTVSFIIAAYNEEKVIREKILNTLELDYPDDLLQIIIVSDGSNDNTYNIVAEYMKSGIVGLHDDERNGKNRDRFSE